MIDAETVARIRHPHHAEGWLVGTIAAQLGLHHETVERALEEQPRGEPLARRSALDPCTEFARETLERRRRELLGELARAGAEAVKSSSVRRAAMATRGRGSSSRSPPREISCNPGFSAHVGEPIAASDQQRLEDTAAYLVRNPLSLKKLIIRRARVNRARPTAGDRLAIPGSTASRRFSTARG